MNAVVAFPSTRRALSASAAAGKRPLTSPHVVRVQLSKILQSDGFARAIRMKRFLAFVVEETLAGRASGLCEYSIGISVFDRKDSFEPGLDPIVRNDARRLRQKLLEYYQRPNLDGDDQIRIEVPRGGYVPTFSDLDPCIATPGERYRLNVSLTRMSDRSQVWATERELCSEKQGLRLLITLPVSDRPA